WVLREACRQLADWRCRGLAVPAISINLSPSNFHDPRLPATIAHMLAQHGLRPGELMLEITESVLMDTTPAFLKILREVHELGVLLSMDDFGTGFSGLLHLLPLPALEHMLSRIYVVDQATDVARSSL